MPTLRFRSRKQAGLLVDHQIRAALDTGDLQIDPREGIDARIQPASLDVRLGGVFGVFRRHADTCIDPKQDSTEVVTRTVVNPDGCFVLHPGEFVLGHTEESIGLADTLLARIEGKSSLGRLGLLVHSTAGFIDPGWPLAKITLELANVNTLPIKLWPGMPIAQLAFERVDQPISGYAGKYVSQMAPHASQFHKNWTGSRWI